MNSNFILTIAKLTKEQIKAIEILDEHKDLFESSGSMDFIIHFFYALMWKFTMLLQYFTSEIEKILDKIITLNDLFNNSKVAELSSALTPVAYGLMAFMLAVIAISISFGKKLPISQLFINVIFATLFIITLPNIFSQANDLKNSFYNDARKYETGQFNYVNNNDKLKTLSSQIVTKNTTDLYYLAKNNFKLKDVNNEFGESTFTNGYRNWAEKINPKLDDEENARDKGFRFYKSLSKEGSVEYEVFTNRIDFSIGGESYKNLELVPLADGIGSGFLKNNESAFSGYYQRYQIPFLYTWFLLGTVIAVNVFTMFKVVRLAFEVATQKIIAPFVAATDLTTMQKTKQILINIFTNYGMIALVILFLKVFFVLSAVVFNADKLNDVAKLICFIALALAVIDGPDEVKKLLGIDVGVKDGYKMAMAGAAGSAMAYRGAKATGTGMKFAGKTASTVSNKSGLNAIGKGVSAKIKDDIKPYTDSAKDLGHKVKDKFGQEKQKDIDNIHNDLGTTGKQDYPKQYDQEKLELDKLKQEQNISENQNIDTENGNTDSELKHQDNNENTEHINNDLDSTVNSESEIQNNNESEKDAENKELLTLDEEHKLENDNEPNHRENIYDDLDDDSKLNYPENISDDPKGNINNDIQNNEDLLKRENANQNENGEPNQIPTQQPIQENLSNTSNVENGSKVEKQSPETKIINKNESTLKSSNPTSNQNIGVNVSMPKGDGSNPTAIAEKLQSDAMRRAKYIANKNRFKDI